MTLITEPKSKKHGPLRTRPQAALSGGKFFRQTKPSLASPPADDEKRQTGKQPICRIWWLSYRLFWPCLQDSGWELGVRWPLQRSLDRGSSSNDTNKGLASKSSGWSLGWFARNLTCASTTMPLISDATSDVGAAMDVRLTAAARKALGYHTGVASQAFSDTFDATVA